MSHRYGRCGSGTCGHGVTLSPGHFLTAARHVVSGDITGTQGFREGRVRLQDEGSQLVAELAPRGETILDCCAAPGGKTLILAERNPDARSWPASQVRSVWRNCGNGLRRGAIALSAGWRMSPRSKMTQRIDVVLADVPCSGTGTLGATLRFGTGCCRRIFRGRRNGNGPSFMLRCARRARREMIYSTCSLEPEENEEVVAAVLAEREDARLVPLQAAD